LNVTGLLPATALREVAEITQPLAHVLSQNAPVGVKWHYEKMPDGKHSTIYHAAALKAFRLVFKPDANERK
jgi:hypothetical protein